MLQILDLHIHSRYSRACSPQLTLANIEAACRQKGVHIIATGDFTYPAWFESIKEELKETAAGSGLYKLKSASDDQVKFILSTEVALIYKDAGKTRRIHLVVHAPNIKAVEKLNNQLDKKYNIRSDGRPILGIKAPEFVNKLLKIDPNFLIYPAHIWTPWFAVFGSKSGFDTLEECFQEETKNIYAFETGLSSDPEMNWRLSSLDNLTMLSNSDAHSPHNIGREANVMEISEPITYQKIYNIIRYQRRVWPSGSDQEGLKMTLEFYPEEGMYHFDGHRDCNFSCTPKESRKLGNICPICHRSLIIGVLSRVNELADRPEGFQLKTAVPFKKLVELDKIIAAALGIRGRQSLTVIKQYQKLLQEFGSELEILLNLDLSQAAVKMDQRIIKGIYRVREQKLFIKPGFDGQYGKIDIFSEQDKLLKQSPLL